MMPKFFLAVGMNKRTIENVEKKEERIV